ncbi:LysR family transcriptional regulator [Roseomonas hellenica]|uniref:LysR family transcriptional regulator n=1 Tax=Plastoroseomonas hellenica TaxID=2687306 RepID=A0ABS5EUI2_9PROT|nr:LysR family transcriptional regulator [Plastoroseomonas hellenica]MBR0663956.1 LysR family transcriptional regulator [Plastoroseomonas hellenica]
MADRNRTAPDWEDIRVFVALARHGSLSAAARALAVNHATIARRLAALEAALGEKLAERRPDGYVLTPAGQRSLAAASEMEAAAAALSRGGAAAGPKGLVRINATPGLAQGFLVPRLAAAAARHPGLDIEVATDLRVVSLERREADIALRLGRPQDGDVLARRLVVLGFGFYATSAWRHRIAQGAAPVFVGFDEASAHIPEALWLAQHFPRARRAFRAGNQAAHAAAAAAGAGIALLPHVTGRADRRLGLCPIEPAPPSRELWLITRRQDGRDPAIRTVSDLLTTIFCDSAALFAPA